MKKKNLMLEVEKWKKTNIGGQTMKQILILEAEKEKNWSNIETEKWRKIKLMMKEKKYWSKKNEKKRNTDVGIGKRQSRYFLLFVDVWGRRYM